MAGGRPAGGSTGATRRVRGRASVRSAGRQGRLLLDSGGRRFGGTGAARPAARRLGGRGRRSPATWPGAAGSVAGLEASRCAVLSVPGTAGRGAAVRPRRRAPRGTPSSCVRPEARDRCGCHRQMLPVAEDPRRRGRSGSSAGRPRRTRARRRGTSPRPRDELDRPDEVLSEHRRDRRRVVVHGRRRWCWRRPGCAAAPQRRRPRARTRIDARAGATCGEWNAHATGSTAAPDSRSRHHSTASSIAARGPDSTVCAGR